MGIVVFGAVLVDIKGYPFGKFVTRGRNAGRVQEVHGGVSRNVVEDIANVELRPTFVSMLDDSGTSQEIIDKLDRHKVNTKYIRHCEGGLANGWPSSIMKGMLSLLFRSGLILTRSQIP